MGWTGYGDPLQQVRLVFPTKEAALAFAESQGWSPTVIETREPTVRAKSYADNFRHRPSGRKRWMTYAGDGPDAGHRVGVGF